MKPHDLNLADPAFSTRSPEVAQARAAHWCARTPFGIAVLRHREAGMLLRDRRLRQGSHAWPETVGLEGEFADFWTGSIIAKEGADHKRLRGLFQGAMRDDDIAALIPKFRASAAELITPMLDRDADFMAAFALPFAGQALCHVLGLPGSDWPRVAEDAATLGLAMGVDAKRHEPSVNAACSRLFALADTLISAAEAGQPGFVGRLLAAADGVDRKDVRNLIVISMFGGVDTTRSQLGHAVALFLDHPEQWSALKTDTTRIDAAVEDMIRAYPTTTWATREALEDFAFGGMEIAKGETVHVLVHASAMDPALDGGSGFDVTAKRRSHFGFGGGAHHCLGAPIARADMAAALEEILARVARFSPAGTPHFRPDSGNTSPIVLPIHAHGPKSSAT